MIKSNLNKMNELEKRMYFFVPYNISPIQQAIQAGHAALEYAHRYKDDPEYIDFIENWKTWIILNGGTTNSHLVKNPDGYFANPRTDKDPYRGSLDNIANLIIASKINYSLFQEPDLNNALTAVCFICDERVFNYTDYPEFYDWFVAQRMFPNAGERAESGLSVDSDRSIDYLKKATIEEQKADFPKEFNMWAKEVMGNDKNIFLRNLIKNKKLA